MAKPKTLQLHPELAGEEGQMHVYDCDTEGDLPSPAWGKFATVRAADDQEHYFYVGTDASWLRAELKPIDD